MSISPHKYIDSKWNIIPSTDITLGKDPKFPNSLSNWVITYGPIPHVLPSSYLLSESLRKHQKVHNYFVDDDDMYWTRHLIENLPEFTWETHVGLFHNLAEFTNMIYKYSDGTKKRLYMRTIPFLPLGDEEVKESRVFVDEVAIMIPLLKEQQDDPFENPERQHFEIFQRLNSNEPGNIGTIPLSKLEELLTEFDINKSLLTLVDDPAHIIGLKSMAWTGVPFKVLSARGDQMINKNEATLYIFQSLVCGVVWEDVSFQEKLKVVNAIHSYAILGEGTYTPFDKVVSTIVRVKQSLSEIYQNRRSKFDVMYHKQSPNELISHEEYEELAVAFDLPLYKLANMKLVALPVWFLRVLLVLGWLHSFVQGSSRMKMYITIFSRVITTGLMPAVPAFDRQFVKDITKEAVGYMKNPLASESGQTKSSTLCAQRDMQKSSLESIQEQEGSTESSTKNSKERCASNHKKPSDKLGS
ncbi:hypothetical protein GCK72_023025 [Caenorhabditis remanei]|uniref:Uncharacterized protein n=1 Tax=Caenorhabditis remanei TaxID=31234 RepID=A0A6A5FVC8_CAERE|nr:hypothetical protein GCK72_023025 [Caenorhabditis remanei]KAF1746568.1 hypothetical protein GCK72_023025 [Caenorhabditis remanei]